MLTLALLASLILQQPSIYDEFGTLRRQNVWGECQVWRNGVVKLCKEKGVNHGINGADRL